MDKGWLRWLPPFVQKRLQGRYTVQTILVNASWLLIDRIIRIGVNLIVGVWVARYLGPAQFGLYNYAFGFVSLFAPLAYLGLENVTVRELVREPDAKDEILGSTLILRLIGGVALVILTLTAIVWLRPYDPAMAWLVSAVALGNLLLAWETIDYWFQSQTLSQYTVYARNIAFLLATLLKIFLIQQQAPLVAFAWVWTTEVGLMAIAQITAYHYNQGRITHWRPTFKRAASLLRHSYPLMLSSFSIIFYMRIDQVMLGNLVGDHAVGIYSVAVRVSEAFYFVPSAITTSVAPSIVSARQTDLRLYQQRLQHTFNLLMVSSYGICTIMAVSAAIIVPLVFGAEYADASPVLIIHIWSLIFVFLTLAREIWIIAEGVTYVSFVASTTGAIANFLLNLYLIPRYGALGAAIATLISYGLSAYGVFILVPKFWSLGKIMTRALLLTWLIPSQR
ncbi:MAG: flippase [Cyanobacteria bacterium]|nr:flippase [Cyanobacteriota bacterium]MDW8200537.1 flippase [Cyanobacteriota bacterium SKYGB_h_bin112]